MSIINHILGRDEPDMTNGEPEVIRNKTYRICTENNPDEKKYRCSGKRDAVSPACKLALHLEGLTCFELREIEMEISNMLERDGFLMR